MPQLWKTGKPATAASAPANQQQGSAMSPPAKGFFICPPKLVLGEAGGGGGGGGGDTPSSASSSNGFFSFPSSPPSSPTSPTHHQHPPKYDQLLNELRRAQERRGRLQNDAAMGVSSQPLQPAAATAATASTVLLKNAPLETMLLRRTIRSPEPPSGAYVNHFNSSGAAGFAQRLDPAGSKSPRMTNKAAPKKVRFLEDGTGNLHTSVFGGSAESIGSLLDSHSQELNQSGGTDDIDSLISSLISYSDATDHRLDEDRPEAKTTNGTAKNHNNADGLDLRELRITATQEEDVRQKLNESTSSSGEDGQRQQQQQAEKATLHHTRSGVLDNFLDIFRCGNAEVVDQRQTVVHLEPDDPNSVDSGSVLSELDFEETSSTITDIDSNKTFSLHSPDNSVDHRIDDWSQVSDLLERSLQEIRQMEEDTNKSHPVDGKSTEKSKREPLYELIGWKRNPPLVQLDLRGSKPFPLPSTTSAPAPQREPSPPRSPSPLPLPPPTPPPVETDVWIPRQDWVPPAAPTPAPMVKQADKVWIRRPTLSVATNSHNSSNNNNKESAAVRKSPATEETNSIYGRLWETSSSPNNSSRSSSCSAEAEEKPTSSTEAELTGKFVFFSKKMFLKTTCLKFSSSAQPSVQWLEKPDWNIGD
uniref:Putative SH2 domain-containing protein 4B n=1 Tax=Daphnia magna TaxID=35525 RepID=A0A0P6DJN4_9CRUS